ncbi:MAG: hypothetical protein AAFV53_12255 [Myxococcota bacterium]
MGTEALLALAIGYATSFTDDIGETSTTIGGEELSVITMTISNETDDKSGEIIDSSDHRIINVMGKITDGNGIVHVVVNNLGEVNTAVEVDEGSYTFSFEEDLGIYACEPGTGDVFLRTEAESSTQFGSGWTWPAATNGTIHYGDKLLSEDLTAADLISLVGGAGDDVLISDGGRGSDLLVDCEGACAVTVDWVVLTADAEDFQAELEALISEM